MTIEFENKDGVATVTITQPHKKNAISPAMWDMLAERFTALSSDPEVRCVVLRGAGTTFCSGSDLDEIDSSGNAADGLARLKRANRMILAIHNCDKPVVSAVQGVAAGVGWSLALACDLSIASANARFIAAFTKVGLVPDGGAVWFLSRQIGMRQAKQIAYLPRFMSADEALSLGLVNAVAPEAEFNAAVDNMARDLAARPTHAIALTKRMFREAMGPGLGGFLEAEEMAQVLAKQSADFAEGVASFLEKRSPRFTGR
jgi:2-(1,2-epoxy-1,2-dihydrophenyl)acetyl-CoA isomerase